MSKSKKLLEEAENNYRRFIKMDLRKATTFDPLAERYLVVAFSKLKKSHTELLKEVNGKITDLQKGKEYCYCRLGRDGKYVCLACRFAIVLKGILKKMEVR